MEDPEAEEISRKCYEIVQKYREEGRRDLAIQDLATVFKVSDDFSALPAYIDILDESDREIHEAGARGKVSASGEGVDFLEGSSRDRVGASREEEDLERGESIPQSRRGRKRSNGKAVDEGRKKKRKTNVQHAGSRRRSRSSTEDDDGDSDSDDAEFNARQFAWRDGLADDDVTQPLSLRTHRLASVYRHHLRSAKRGILDQYGAPTLPVSVWKEVLTDQYVDLDKIYSFLCVGNDQREKHTLGDIEISHGAATASKSIAVSGDCFYTWPYYSRAVLFAFPHRVSELSEYFEYISGNFRTIPSWDVGSVLRLDQAIRKRVATTSDLTLQDLPKFYDLHMRYLSYKGADSADAERGARDRGGGSTRRRPLDRFRRNEPCARWNRGSFCNGETCIFRHACERCDSSHRRIECRTKGGKKGEERSTA